MPIFVLDSTGRLIFANLAWEELTGWNAQDVVQRLICRRTGSRPADAELAALGDDLAPPPEAWSGAPCASRIAVTHRDGTRRFRTLESWPLSDRRNAVMGLLGFIRPIDDPPIAPAAESHQLRADLLELRDHLQRQYGWDHLVGVGDAHRRLLNQARAAASADLDLLIVGEPGTGKRVVARTIHQQGPRRDAPLIPFDCAALPPDVLARELREGRKTWPEQTTLLIGDILDVPRDVQMMLTEVADGSIRLLTTTTGDPDRAVHEDRLHPALYYRLTTLVLRLQPLRDRLGELPLIAQALLERANQRSAAARVGFSADALAALAAYDWPGNLRELERVIDQAHASATRDRIEIDDVPASIRGDLGAAYPPPLTGPAVTPLDGILEQVERRLIEQALARARHNKSKAAELLAISRPRLYRRITELRIPEAPEPDPNGDD